MAISRHRVHLNYHCYNTLRVAGGEGSRSREKAVKNRCHGRGCSMGDTDSRRENQKSEDLAADITTQYPGWRVDVLALSTTRKQTSVARTSSLVLRCMRVCKDVQCEVLCSAAQTIRQHLSQCENNTHTLAEVCCA